MLRSPETRKAGIQHKEEPLGRCRRACGIEWPDEQTGRRFAECTVQDVDLDDLVLEVEVVEVVVSLVVVQFAVAVSARMRTWREQAKITFFKHGAYEAATQCSHLDQ